MKQCLKCGSIETNYDEGETTCWDCGAFLDENTTPYPGNATREQWVQEVAARILCHNAFKYAVEDAIGHAEAFVAACDQHFNRD